MAQAIDLDESVLGKVVDAGADTNLSARLRTMRSRDPQRFSVNTTFGLAAAAWTIRKQFSLASLVQMENDGELERLGFTPSDDYGSPLSPDYKKGYELAQKTRELLGISAEDPISSMKELIEVRLKIPVIQVELNSEFAGATVASGDRRGIVVNLVGDNQRPWVRRMTMAHELAHLLWDPDQKLRRLVVDRYEAIYRDATSSSSTLDRVERRANAFAIEFLAPGETIVREFDRLGKSNGNLEKIANKFGVSNISVARHLANSSYNRIDLVSERFGDNLLDEWEGAESLGVPLFDPQTVPVSRRGRFSYYVLKAFENGLISDETAASLFSCTVKELYAALKSTRDMIGS